MNTKKIKGSFKMIKRFMKEGDVILKNKDDNNILNEYYQCLKSHNKENTIAIKLRSVYFFGKYLESIKKNFKTLTKEDIYDHINQCLEVKSWGLNEQANVKSRIKLFLNWMFEKEFINISGNIVFPIINWPSKTNIKTYYTKEEITQMLDSIDTKTASGKEDYLILIIISYLGLRISDVINLKLSDINFEKRIISLVQFKTGTPLILPLIDIVRYPLIDYIKNVRPNDCELDYLFVTTEKPYKQKTNIRNSKKVKKYLIKSGIEIGNRKKGYHALRHSFSTLLMSENVSLYSISKILGHKYIDTTLDYLDINVKEFKKFALEVPICK